MEERRALGFRVRPRFAEVLDYIEEGETLKLPQPDRRVSTYVQSHFYLDEFPHRAVGRESETAHAAGRAT